LKITKNLKLSSHRILQDKDFWVSYLVFWVSNGYSVSRALQNRNMNVRIDVARLEREKSKWLLNRLLTRHQTSLGTSVQRFLPAQRGITDNCYVSQLEGS